MTDAHNDTNPTYASREDAYLAAEMGGFTRDTVTVRKDHGRYVWDFKASIVPAVVVDLDVTDAAVESFDDAPFESNDLDTLLSRSEGSGFVLPLNGFSNGYVASGCADIVLPIAADVTAVQASNVTALAIVPSVTDAPTSEPVTVASDGTVYLRLAYSPLAIEMLRGTAMQIARKLSTPVEICDSVTHAVLETVSGHKGESHRPTGGTVARSTSGRVAFKPYDDDGWDFSVLVTEFNADGTPNSHYSPSNGKTQNNRAQRINDAAAKLDLDALAACASNTTSTYYQYGNEYLAQVTAKVRAAIVAREAALDAEFGAIAA